MTRKCSTEWIDLRDRQFLNQMHYTALAAPFREGRGKKITNLAPRYAALESFRTNSSISALAFSVKSPVAGSSARSNLVEQPGGRSYHQCRTAGRSRES